MFAGDSVAMSIVFKCICGNAFNVADEHAGRIGACPKCKMPITVPGEPPKAAAAAVRQLVIPREALMAYLRGHQSSNIFVIHPHVPPEREISARQFFGIEPDDGILAVFHPSLLVGGQETIVLTENGLYVKKADLTRGHVAYESLIEGSIHLEGDRDIVVQAVKPQRLRFRVLVQPGIAEYLSKILRGLQLLLNGRDPSPIFAAQANNALQDLRAERQGLLPSSTATGGSNASSSGEKQRRGLLGGLRGKGRN